MFVNKDNFNNSLKIWLLCMYSLLVFIVFVGGITRLTDSGLSITSWELFSGILPPLNSEKWNYYFSEYKKIPEFEFINSKITLDEFKIIFYWEYGHRLLARVVALVSLLPIIYLTIKYKKSFLFMSKYYLIFFLICLQGFLGWYMVTSGLVSNIDVSHYRLATHLCLAFIILLIILWYIFQVFEIKKFNVKISNLFLIPLFLLLFLQIIIGAFLAGLDGGLIYNTWPDMNGLYSPNDVSFKEYFYLKSFSNPSIIQFYHRIIGYTIIIYILFLNYRYFKNNLEFKSLIFFNAAVLLQIALGVMALLSGVEIKYASPHQIGSILVISSYLFIFYKNYSN